MSLTLYYHPLASFCHKVLIALYENGHEFEKRIINVGEDADRAELTAMWPICKFPVIRDNERLTGTPPSTCGCGTGSSTITSRCRCKPSSTAT
jgi:glutathione S-transferase